MSDKSPPKDLLEWLGITDAPDWRVARPLGIIVSGLITLLILGALAAAFVLIGRTIAGGMETAAGNLGAGALIVAILGAPFLVWSTVIKQKTVDFQKETHITERISKAVEQLGAEKTVKREGEESTQPNIEVRIGGLLSLERIAQDSTRYDKGRDHVRVMEILCAYVRENSNATAPQNFPFPEWEPLKDDATKQERAEHIAARKERFGDRFQTSEARSWAHALPKPRADIQQALDILGRRDANQRRAEACWGKDAAPKDEWVFDKTCPPLPDAASQADLITFKSALESWQEKIRSYRGYRPDLRGANLQNADLSSAILSGARLNGARLEGANLRNARMEGARLSDARLEGADLYRVRLQGAGLTRAQLEGAFLLSARLEGANLRGARLEGAHLELARLEEASLRGARLEGAHLSKSRLDGAVLWKAQLEGADLSGARLEGADLRFARLEGADLADARFDATTEWKYASLRGASIRSVDFTTTPISAEQVSQTLGDGSTKLPDTIPRPAHWPEADLGRHFQAELKKYRADPAGYSPPPETEGG